MKRRRGGQPRISLALIRARCISAGDTFEQAVANAGEALAGHLALMKADGDSIPAPRSFEELKHDPEFVADSAGAIVTIVTPSGAMAAAE